MSMLIKHSRYDTQIKCYAVQYFNCSVVIEVFSIFNVICLFLIRLLSKVAGKRNTAEISSLLFWETRYSN